MTCSAKRVLDVSLGAMALLVLLPLIAAIAAAVRIVLGAPVLFAQLRPGQHGKIFQILKFRTMSDARDEAGHLLSDDRRLGWFGSLLRSTSLDELPELWNVLKGEMSLVGPRPLLLQYLPRYTHWQQRRHEVKPGLTGWAQVNGRNALRWEEKFAFDVWYVDHQGFWLDCKILWLTVAAVVCRTGIRAEGHATMPEFLGTSATGEVNR
jgi:sugar transferase EpsL